MTRMPGCCFRIACDLRDGEAGVDRAVALPQDHLRALDLIGIEAAENLVRIPHDHLVERDAHLVGGVAAEMLVGQEEHLLAARERPLQRGRRIRRRADRAAALADERFDRGRGIDVGHRHDAGLPERRRDAHLRQLFPAGLELVGRDHVGHRAAGREVGQDDLLVRRREHVGALRHEVHAAEHDVVGVGPGGDLARQAERVAGVVGELDDLVALIVMAEDDEAVAERRACGRNAGIHLGVGQTRDTSPGSAWRSEMCSFSNSVSSGMMDPISCRPWLALPTL